MFFMLTLAFGGYVYTEKQLDRAHQQRHRSYQLANQLRQSSDELTRMVRTYVVTGDTRFKTYYQTILDIRNGNKARPLEYFYIYWDLVLDNPLAQRPDDGPAIPLLELIRQAGFTEQELAKLQQAKANSDALTTLEFEAMKLAETPGQHADGEHARARLMVHDANYHRAKAEIMQPINQVYQSMDQRTQATIERARDMALLFRLIFILSVMISAYLLWRAYAGLRSTLGGSTAEVQAQMQRIARADFSGKIVVAPGMEQSVLAKLSEMQDQLSVYEKEREHSLTEIRESEQRYRSLVEWSPEPIVVHRDARLLYANPAAVKMFGAESAGQLVGKPILELVHPDFHFMVLARLKQFAETGAIPGMVEQGYLKLDGTPIDVEVQGKSLMFDGAPAVYVAIRDITERRRLDRLKAEFVSTVSHELRTPLTSIHASLRLLECGIGGTLPPPAVKLVELAQKNSQRLVLLVNDILDIDKLAAGKMTLNLQTVDLVAIVQQALVDNAIYGANLNVAFVLGTHPPLALALADANRLAQVMANLLSNAAKFSSQSAQVEIRILTSEGKARVEVEDHGEGIQADFQDEIFAAFAQANRSDTRQQGGTGLGLKISKSLIDAMQGEIGFTTTPGQGSTFWFTLALAQPQNTNASTEYDI